MKQRNTRFGRNIARIVFTFFGVADLCLEFQRNSLLFKLNNIFSHSSTSSSSCCGACHSTATSGYAIPHFALCRNFCRLCLHCLTFRSRFVWVFCTKNCRSVNISMRSYLHLLTFFVFIYIWLAFS